jgi:putative aminopeptidase FrvX
MNRDEILALLSELIACHSPPGEEQEIDAVLRREFEATGAGVWSDHAGNLYARLAGSKPDQGPLAGHALPCPGRH